MSTVAEAIALGKTVVKFQQNLPERDALYELTYPDWYYARMALSHQMRTRDDEQWLATQIGAKIKGTGKQQYNGVTKDLGDGFVGEELIPGVNNFDLKVTFKERKTIENIGFQQYRPADPIGFYILLMGMSPAACNVFVIPGEVVKEMKTDKVLRTGKCGSAHGTGATQYIDKYELVDQITNGSHHHVLSFIVNKKSDKENFDKLMKYCMKIEDVADFINNYKGPL